MNNMEEDIKILEDYIELIKKGYCEDCNELCNIFGTPTYPSKKISEASEHLIKAYKEREEEMNKINQQLDLDYVDKNFIPVSLVEEIIEELKEEIEQLRIEKNVTFDSGIYRNQIKLEVLQELLEKRK